MRQVVKEDADIFLLREIIKKLSAISKLIQIKRVLRRIEIPCTVGTSTMSVLLSHFQVEMISNEDVIVRC